MNIVHWVEGGWSGLTRTTLELAKYESLEGHTVDVRHPETGQTWAGKHVEDVDVHCIHHQIPPQFLKSQALKVFFLHGEPHHCIEKLGAIQAIMDLMDKCDVVISFHETEIPLWKSFGRVHYVPKFVNVDRFKPDETIEKYTGNPAVLFMEHWREFRSPLDAILAVEKVRELRSGIKLYLVGCPNEERAKWDDIIRHNKYDRFVSEVVSQIDDIHQEYQHYDLVISPVCPSYGRVALEATACGVPTVGWNTNPHLSFSCNPFDIDGLANCIFEAIENPPSSADLRKYALKHFNVKRSAKHALRIYRRYLEAIRT